MNTVQERQNQMTSFMSMLKSEEKARADKMELENNPILKERQLETCKGECKQHVVNQVFGKMYLDSLPLDDDYKEIHSGELMASMSKFIEDNGGLNFIQERLKDTKSRALKTIIEAADEASKKYEERMKEKLPSLTVKDINFQPTQVEDDIISKVSSDLELDEVSAIVQDEVKRTLDDEIERSKYEEDQKVQLQAELEADDNVATEAAIDKAIEERYLQQSKLYQPSLFESIMISESAKYDDKDEALGFALAEYTKHALAKTMRLKDYTIDETTKLSNAYRR